MGSATFPHCVFLHCGYFADCASAPLYPAPCVSALCVSAPNVFLSFLLSSFLSFFFPSTAFGAEAPRAEIFSARSTVADRAMCKRIVQKSHSAETSLNLKMEKTVIKIERSGISADRQTTIKTTELMDRTDDPPDEETRQTE